MKIKEKVHLENLVKTLEGSLSRMNGTEQLILSKRAKLDQNLEQLIQKENKIRTKLSQTLEKLETFQEKPEGPKTKVEEKTSPKLSPEEGCRRMFELYKSQGWDTETILGLLDDYPEEVVKEIQKEF